MLAYCFVFLKNFPLFLAAKSIKMERFEHEIEKNVITL